MSSFLRDHCILLCVYFQRVSTGRNVTEAIGGGSMLIKEYRICMPISVEEVFHKNRISKKMSSLNVLPNRLPLTQSVNGNKLSLT